MTARATAPADQPPRLDLALGRRLKSLLLINTPLFLIGTGVAIWVARSDHVSFALDGDTLVPYLIVLLLSCLVVAISAWGLLPVARWLRAYPAWHYRHRSRLLWALPALAGYLVWLVLWLLGLALLLLAAAAVVVSLLDLYDRGRAAHPPPAQGEAPAS